MTQPLRSTREGMTLIELLIAMVIAAVILQAALGFFMGQSRLVGENESRRSARDISRTAVHVFMADLRRVETQNGVQSASASAVEVLVPFALGIVCESSPGAMTVSLLPTDSVRLADADDDGFAGYALRNTSGAYVGFTAASGLGTGAQADCVDAEIAVFGAQYVRAIEPGTGGASVGMQALLYDRIEYEFQSEDEGLFLYRTVNGGTAEQLVGPFDPDETRFRFFSGPGAATDAPPANLQNLSGLELVLQGLGNRPEAGSGEYATAPLTTSVFFKNGS